jgi:hypothetical protein
MASNIETDCTSSESFRDCQPKCGKPIAGLYSSRYFSKARHGPTKSRRYSMVSWSAGLEDLAKSSSASSSKNMRYLPRRQEHSTGKTQNPCHSQMLQTENALTAQDLEMQHVAARRPRHTRRFDARGVATGALPFP